MTSPAELSLCDAAERIRSRGPSPPLLAHLTLHVRSARVRAMDVAFVLRGIAFVWDEDKARANPGNHDGITFEQAAEAFFDPFLKVVDASRNDEVRHAVIGMDTRWNLLFIVHIEVEDEAIRLISARRATRRERAEYEA